MKLYRFLGKRGRITLPLPLRERLDIRPGDLLSFAETEDGMGIILRQETVCDGCGVDDFDPDMDEGDIDSTEDGNISLQEYLESLTPQQQRAALIVLSTRIAYP